MRIATSPIEASVIREIPFRNASEAVTIVLSQVKAVTKWPAVLEAERFAAERRRSKRSSIRQLQEDEEGDISADTLEEGSRAGPRPSRQADGDAPRGRHGTARKRWIPQDPGGSGPNARTARYQRGIQPIAHGQVDVARQLDRVHGGFNLRFGAATTPAQRIIYRELFPVLDELRDRVLKGAKLDDESPSWPIPARSATSSASSMSINPRAKARNIALEVRQIVLAAGIGNPFCRWS